MLLGVDTGGTFTDFVLQEDDRVRLHKVLSTPEAPERAILQGIRELGLETAVGEGAVRIVHGSTVATNAALEGKGVRTAYVTNRGLGDLLSLGRQNRAALYDLTPSAEAGPVPVELCLEVGARMDHRGLEVTPLEAADIDALLAAIDALAPAAVAINLLYGWLDDRHERALEAAIGERFPDIFVTRSSFVLPEYKEYERGMATWLNAWLGPRVQGYLDRLAQALAPSSVAIMQSSGGTMEAAVASRRAVNLLLSGPAGGIAGARHVAASAGLDALLSFDMGGTSTDVALIRGEPVLTVEARIGPWPVAVPMLDIHTIGAGGGSIARIDAGGALQVGPESAGADPGPACYGRGGDRATVTDAHVVLGRMPSATALGGSMALDVDAAGAALRALGEPLGWDAARAAEAVLALANEHMARALRVMSVERGVDPRDQALCCFGGAGGLHLCAIAELLGVERALVPVHGGVLSALGMLVARPERQLSRTLTRPLADIDRDEIGAMLGALEAAGRDELAAEGQDRDAIDTDRAVELRYRGQAFALSLPYADDDAELLAERFGAAHAERYGHRLATEVELVNLRVRVRAPAGSLHLPSRAEGTTPAPRARVPVHGQADLVPLWARDDLGAGARLAGPAIITEATSTTWIAEGWAGHADARGNLHLERA
ncbi:MAG TPA: hydantoinase/oxoprolinase family protein [Pseudomonadales bacterium]|nr:hydantoinase/oxoprolinase family protein [Pseudomonadales bacterium]